MFALALVVRGVGEVDVGGVVVGRRGMVAVDCELRHDLLERVGVVKFGLGAGVA